MLSLVLTKHVPISIRWHFVAQYPRVATPERREQRNCSSQVELNALMFGFQGNVDCVQRSIFTYLLPAEDSSLKMLTCTSFVHQSTNLCERLTNLTEDWCFLPAISSNIARNSIVCRFPGGYRNRFVFAQVQQSIICVWLCSK